MSVRSYKVSISETINSNPLLRLVAFEKWLRAYDEGSVPRSSVVEECERKGVRVEDFDSWLERQREQLRNLTRVRA